MEQDKFIELVKEHKSFEVALSISARDDNRGWRCPVCEKPVTITGRARYETLIEHVSDPNMREHPLRDKYQCSDEECITRKSDMFWDYYGDRYGSIIDENGKRVWSDDKIFINGNDSPFGSDSRRRNVEINKKGVKDRKFLHPALCLWFLQPMIDYTYKADNDGNVIKKGFNIKFLKKDKDRGEYCYHFHPCWGTWSFLFSRFKNRINQYKSTKNIDELKRAFKPSINRAWDYRWFETFTKIVYYKYYTIQK